MVLERFGHSFHDQFESLRARVGFQIAIQEFIHTTDTVTAGLCRLGGDSRITLTKLSEIWE